MVRSRDLPTNHKVSSQKVRVLDLPVKWCGGWDLNPRTPTGQGPEPCAFDLAWQPPLEVEKHKLCFIKPSNRSSTISLQEKPRVP